jgi:hypothetical protein
MKFRLVITAKFALWVILMLLYAHFVLFASDSRFAYAPDWSPPPQSVPGGARSSPLLLCSGLNDSPCPLDSTRPAVCEGIIDSASDCVGASRGWPLRVDKSIDGNPIWLIWSIDGTVMALFGALIAVPIIMFPFRQRARKARKS